MELDFLKPFQKLGAALIKKKAIGEILFSEGTYEIEIKDKPSIWPYLHLDDSGHILDAFCRCPNSEKKGGCSHLAAAYLTIFDGFNTPLHVRFKESFFNALFLSISENFGFEKTVLKKKKNGFSCLKEDLFLQIDPISKTGQNKLKEILSLKILPTEETSLKFSSLSMDEITLVKEGRASFEVMYELSFWSDIARWLFLLQDKKKSYQIIFKEEKEKLPKELTIKFSEVKILVNFNQEILKKIIPSLKNVEANLKFFEYEQETIKQIVFDPEAKRFLVEKNPRVQEQKIEGLNIDEWIYVHKQGFFHHEPDPLLNLDVIEKDQVNELLSLYPKSFQKYLQGIKIKPQEKAAKYFLFFDENDSLHIRLFVEDKDDFLKPQSTYFGKWVYVQDRGFYCLTDLFFEGIEKIVLRDEICDFINKNREWLHNFEGFQTHFGSMEAHLIYSFNKDQDLEFSSKFDFPKEFEKAIDFDDWIYIKGIGFYSKNEKKGNLPLRPGLIVKNEEIGSFIEKHHDELELVTGFFTNKQPIEKIGISIEVNQQNKILIKPKVETKEGFDLSNFKFFSQFAYLENEGFVKIAQKLPEKYDQERVIDASQEPFFLGYELDRLKPYIVFLDKRLRKPINFSLQITSILKRRKKHRNIFIVGLRYSSELGNVNAFDIYKALQGTSKYLFSDAGLIFLKQARFNWFRSLNKWSVDIKQNFFKLSTLEWIRLSLFEELKLPTDATKDAQKILDELKSFETDRLLNIESLKATLRPYQEIGVKWLWFLYCHGLSGLLCDDMGLGKTHQAMALLAAIVHETPNLKYLVVCPTSVIYHWEELLRRFLPSLKVLVYHGLQRDIEEFHKNADVLLTSYGIVRSEKEIFKKLKFELCIFDEVQIAKNHFSQTHKSLRKIHSKMKIGLTGTPIENRIRELKAIFDLVLPSYLPSDSIFLEYFINPIEKEKDEGRQKLLGKLIKPFVMRRKKSEVLFDLPEKVEELSFCDLSLEQKELYNATLSLSKETVLKELKDENKPFSYLHVFALLSKLKQICNHPSLILKDYKSYQKHISGKFELFKELLSEAKESSQKVVVFSQYLGMLKIIESYLHKNNIGFASIKGETKKRYEEVKKFREDPKCEVFVASLLAAGVGIDLSCASVVIHYDRWWNPAKENQATDRVHRIGQNRGVQVFKLVAKSTIEEKIHALIERKKDLIEKTIGKDEADQIKSLTKEEIIAIFEQIQA
ncbi:MAG: DEAD/DEAH box helicase [Chlamydiae bacterium]|nr:DEAD/DEAH box helicase [Chlamydiota bacterium]